LSPSRSTATRLLCAVGLVLATAVVPGCAREVTSVRPRAIEAADPDPGTTLRSLHDKIVYVVQESEDASDALHYTYRLYWIDPREKKPHLLLTSRDPAGEDVTTFYLPGRDKTLVHMAPSQNTRTGNDYVAGIDGTDPTLLVRGHVVDVFPDGKHLLVRSDLDEGGQTYFLYSADMNGKILKRLTSRPKGVVRKTGSAYMYEGDWGGAVSPDGASIVYASSWYSQGGGPNDLFRVDSDGSHRTRLTDAKKSDTDFRVEGFSHDGTRLAVTETTGYGTASPQSALSLMDPDGRVVRRYPTGDPGGFGFGGWSPTDEQVALMDAGKLVVMDVRTGSRATILTLGDTEDTWITSAVWLE